MQLFQCRFVRRINSPRDTLLCERVLASALAHGALLIRQIVGPLFAGRAHARSLVELEF